MNPQQNNIPKEVLLRQYQTDIMDQKNRKAMEKQERINQERFEMNRLQMELEEERKYKQQNKESLMNSQKAEYEYFLNQKKNTQREKSLNIYRKKDSEPQGTYKISGENREIKRKNYEDELDILNLNPTRRGNNKNNNQAYNNEILEQKNLQNQAAAMNRGRSQGYNILNHEVQERNNKIIHYENNSLVGGINNVNFIFKYHL